MPPVTVEASPVAVAAELDIRLGQFNEEQIGPRTPITWCCLFAMAPRSWWLVWSARLCGMPRGQRPLVY